MLQLYSRIKKYFSTAYFRDIFLQSSGNTFAQILSIFFIPILSRLYSPADFGVLSMFLVFTSFLSILLTFRLEYFIVSPQEDDSAKNLFNFILIFGLILTIILTIILAFFSKEILRIVSFENISKWAIFSPITAFLTSLAIASQQLIQRNQYYLKSGISEIVNKIAYFLFALLSFYIFKGIIGLLLATFVGLFCKYIWLNFSKESLFKFSIKFIPALNVARLYKSSAIAFSFSNLLLIITGYVPVYVIANSFGTSELGYWHLVTSVVYIPTSFIGIAIGQVYYERAAKLSSSGESLYEIWFSTLKLLTVISFPLFLFISVISPFAFTLVFGDNWAVAGKYASVFSITAAFSFIAGPLDRTCYILGMLNYPFVISFFRMLLSLTTGFICMFLKVSMETYLWFHVLQTTIMYLVDIFFGWLFVNKSSNPIILLFKRN